MKKILFLTIAAIVALSGLANAQESETCQPVRYHFTPSQVTVHPGESFTITLVIDADTTAQWIQYVRTGLEYPLTGMYMTGQSVGADAYAATPNWFTTFGYNNVTGESYSQIATGYCPDHWEGAAINMTFTATANLGDYVVYTNPDGIYNGQQFTCFHQTAGTEDSQCGTDGCISCDWASGFRQGEPLTIVDNTACTVKILPVGGGGGGGELEKVRGPIVASKMTWSAIKKLMR